ncbi:potassium transporter TrkG [uncultured Roseobacter sp.]|uniref:TrkH family potassium uptake protein n=1 Tax=uncultured Roseobacter sp. TaxID=114847 RepID=UPI00261D2420|nr:potassium transporter TrkG [uncultured Roseobacter sp.]
MLWSATEEAWLFALVLLVPGVAGMLLWWSVRHLPQPADLRQAEAVVVLAFLFIIVPLLSVPAFAVLGLPGIDGLFEGMSAITTTGLSVASDTSKWPFAAHVLRSWMQWCGGLAMATAVLAMLIGPGAMAREMGRAGLDEGDRIASTRSRARQLLGAYAGLTLLFWLAISASTGSVTTGLLLSLSAVSTGGFAFLPDSLGSYSKLTQILVIVASVSGAISLLAVAFLSKGDWREAWKLGSFQRVAMWSAAALAVLICTMLALDETAYYAHAMNLLSAISTAGFSVSDMPAHPVLLLIFVVAMIFGGDAGSTAGGIKLARLTTLLRATRHAARQPRLPENAVAPLREYGQPVSDSKLIGLLAIFLLYSTSVLILWSGFLAGGYPPMPALFDTVSAFSTVGLSAGVISPDLSTSLKAGTVLAMLMGRLEFIAILLLVLPRTWHIPSQRS